MFNGKTQISGQLKKICMGDSIPKYRLRLYKTVPFFSLTANRLLHDDCSIKLHSLPMGKNAKKRGENQQKMKKQTWRPDSVSADFIISENFNAARRTPHGGSFGPKIMAKWRG